MRPRTVSQSHQNDDASCRAFHRARRKGSWQILQLLSWLPPEAMTHLLALSGVEPAGMRDVRRDRLEDLGSRLRSLRRHAGLTGAELAVRSGVTQPTISKIETGRMLPSATVVDRVAAALDLDGGALRELHELVARVNAEVVALRQAGERAYARQEVLSGRERAAHAIGCFQCAAVPALLQTAEYARRAFGAARSEDEEDVARAVAARVERQSILYEPGREFSFVLTEGALRTWPGTPGVMLAQLDKIASVSTLENVRLGVVPWSVAVPYFPLHGFAVYDGTAVTVETFTSELTVDDEADVATYTAIFDAFDVAAIRGDAMRELLERIAEDYRQQVDSPPR